MNQPDQQSDKQPDAQPEKPLAKTPVADEQAEQPAAKNSGSGLNWPLGLAVAVIGGLLLARNLGYELFFLQYHNWWAFFILLAAIGPLQQAYSFYHKNGFGAPVVNSLVSAGAIVFISLIFLLDLSFSTWWPIFVIIAGLYLMSSRYR